MQERLDNFPKEKENYIDQLYTQLARTNTPQKVGLNVNDADHKDYLKISKVPPSPPCFRIKTVRFRQRKDIQIASEQFIKSCYRKQKPFIFYLHSTAAGVTLQLGYFTTSDEKKVTKEDIDFLSGIFLSLNPGCEIEPIEESLSFKLDSLHAKRVIVGIPDRDASLNVKQNEPDKTDGSAVIDFGIERLVDSADGKEFALCVTAFPLEAAEIKDFRSKISDALDQIHPLTKNQRQQTDAVTQGLATSDTVSITQTITEGISITFSDTKYYRKNLLQTISENVKAIIAGGTPPGGSITVGEGINKNIASGKQDGKSITKNDGTTITKGQTNEQISKDALYCEEILNTFHKRAEQGLGIGMWNVVPMILARDDATASSVSDIFMGIMSGHGSHADSLRAIEVPPEGTPFAVLKIGDPQYLILGKAYKGISSYLTSKELACYTCMPFHDMPLLDVQELVEYARFIPAQLNNDEDGDNGVRLGCLIDRHQECKSKSVSIPLSRLNRHCFVTGATGSGKSTTIRTLLTRLWKDKGIPFLVIDPVKTDYSALKIDGLKVFTLGRGNCTFKLNPFEFEKEVGLSPHIDYLKAAFNASLGMYSSMPYIVEEILYKVYENSGWSITSDLNDQFERAKKQLADQDISDKQGYYLPRLSDLLPLVEKAINDFFPKMTDYGGSLMGAIRSRLSSMTKGAKGVVLNSRRSYPMDELLKTPCIIELWPFSDNEEKSFVMALLLIKLFEFRQAEYLKKDNNKIQTPALKHLLVIEEAHRLLAKPQGHSETIGSGRNKGVEVFADILAEIRAYGEGIIVADQIPSKLIDDVIKNTDIKIAHRIVARDDKEILASTMLLDKKQAEDLSRQRVGMATMFFEGMDKPVKLRVAEKEGL